MAGMMKSSNITTWAQRRLHPVAAFIWRQQPRPNGSYWATVWFISLKRTRKTPMVWLLKEIARFTTSFRNVAQYRHHRKGWNLVLVWITSRQTQRGTRSWMEAIHEEKTGAVHRNQSAAMVERRADYATKEFQLVYPQGHQPVVCTSS